MASQSSSAFITDWYSPGADSSHLDPVKEAYAKAVDYFKTELTSDEFKRVWVDSKGSMSDIEKTVIQAKQLYEQSEKGKARKWLSRFSARVMYYGAIITMSQHHPEYVSLVWGAMKFVFIGILNHEELVTKFSRVLSEIADVLPRVKLNTVLYPTALMLQTVAMLYAQIIKFFHEAVRWYKEGKLKHIYTAIARPASLKLNDLVEEIATCSKRVDKVAETLSRAELRDMHTEQQLTHIKVSDLSDAFRAWMMQNGLSARIDSVLAEQAATRAAIAQMEQNIIRRLQQYEEITSVQYINTNQRIYDLQLSQILAFTSATNLISPEASLKFCMAMQKKRRSYLHPGPEIQRCAAPLETWASAKASSLIMIQGDLKTRDITKDIATNVINLILKAKAPVIWALNSHKLSEFRESIAIEILKQFVSQALRINTALHDERSASLTTARFQRARTEEEWFDLLGSVIAGLPRLFIILDVELFGPQSEDALAWPVAFLSLFQMLALRKIDTSLKVALVSYRTNLQVPINKKGHVNVVSLRKRDIGTSRSVLARPLPSARSPRNYTGLNILRRQLIST